MGEEKEVYRVLVGKPAGRRPLRRPRHRWVDNIRMDLQEVGCGFPSFHIAWGRDEVTRGGENYIMRSFVICTAHPILCGLLNREDERGGVCSAYGGEGKRPLVRPRCRWEDNIKMDLQEVG